MRRWAEKQKMQERCVNVFANQRSVSCTPSKCLSRLLVIYDTSHADGRLWEKRVCSPLLQAPMCFFPLAEREQQPVISFQKRVLGSLACQLQ